MIRHGLIIKRQPLADNPAFIPISRQYSRKFSHKSPWIVKEKSCLFPYASRAIQHDGEFDLTCLRITLNECLSRMDLSAPRRLQASLLPQWNRLALRPPMALERSFGGPLLVLPDRTTRLAFACCTRNSSARRRWYLMVQCIARQARNREMFRQDGLDLPVREHRGRADRTLAPLAPRRVIALFRPCIQWIDATHA